MYKRIGQQLGVLILSSCGREVNAYTGKSFADKAGNRLIKNSERTHIDVIILKNLTCQSPRKLSG